MAHLYSLFDFYIPYGNFNFILVLVLKFPGSLNLSFHNLSIHQFSRKNLSLAQFIPRIYNKIIIKILGYFWDITFGLEMDCMALTVNFPLTSAISQDPNDLGVVGVLVKPIKRLRGDMGKTTIAIDRLRTEVDQYSPHSNFLKDVGGEIGVEFSHHTHRSWMRWLAKSSPSLSRNRFAEKIVRVMKTLLLDKRTVLSDSVEPIGGTLVHEPRDIIIWG